MPCDEVGSAGGFRNRRLRWCLSESGRVLPFTQNVSDLFLLLLQVCGRGFRSRRQPVAHAAIL
jgi:hypothetical protein